MHAIAYNNALSVSWASQSSSNHSPRLQWHMPATMHSQFNKLSAQCQMKSAQSLGIQSCIYRTMYVNILWRPTLGVNNIIYLYNQLWASNYILPWTWRNQTAGIVYVRFHKSFQALHTQLDGFKILVVTSHANRSEYEAEPGGSSQATT